MSSTLSDHNDDGGHDEDNGGRKWTLLLPRSGIDTISAIDQPTATMTKTTDQLTGDAYPQNIPMTTWTTTILWTLVHRLMTSWCSSDASIES